MRSEQERKEGFLKRNKAVMDKLDNIVEDLNPLGFIMSSELAIALLGYTDQMVDDEPNGIKFKYLRYNGVRVIRDPYAASGAIRVLHRKPDLEFEVPCVCGWFSDENHGAGIGGDLK